MTRQARQILSRMLTAEQAAAYLGYKTTEILASIPVKPVKMVEVGPGCQPKYDLHALDAWLDRLSGLSVPAAAEAAAGPSDDPDAQFASWKASRGAR